MCYKMTGKPPVSVKWVDTNKGTDDEPMIRCRLVARDFKGCEKHWEDLFHCAAAVGAQQSHDVQICDLLQER